MYPSSLSRAHHSRGSRAFRAALTAVTVLVVVAGCSVIPFPTPTPNHHSDPVEASIEHLRIPSSPASRRYYQQKVPWTSCGDGMKCARISAPLDWADPSGTGIHLALLKRPATGMRLGTLLVNPGGPGESGVQLVASGKGYATDSQIESRYDIVGFDPRGVGDSSAVDCGGPANLDAYLYGTVHGTIGSASWIAGQEAKSRAFAKACADDTGPLLAHIDTVSAARDLDLMRAVLGESKLNYLGYSYGTYLGTVYAGLFPGRVGRMVFDGPDNPWEGGDSGSSSQATGFDDEFDAYLKSCLAGEHRAVDSKGCPFSGSLPAVTRRVESLLSAADAHPLRSSDGRELNGATLSTAISDAMYSTDSWPTLTKAFRSELAGHASGMFALADDYNGRTSDGEYYDNSNEMFTAIGCLEDGSSVDLKADASELTALRRNAPVLGQYASYTDLGCVGWPYGPTTFPKPIHAKGAAPILLVATTGDPATPYSGATALARQLDSAHLVTFHGDGHTAYNLGHPCVDSAVDTFLVDGAVPTVDPQCRD